MSMTVYISIGNSDDKLSQTEWSSYLWKVRDCTSRFTDQLIGSWVSETSSYYQNACLAIVTETPLTLKHQLSQLRAEYGQDSMAWAVVPETEFI